MAGFYIGIGIVIGFILAFVCISVSYHIILREAANAQNEANRLSAIARQKLKEAVVFHKNQRSQYRNEWISICEVFQRIITVCGPCMPLDMRKNLEETFSLLQNRLDKWKTEKQWESSE
jgi:hypothetical protein